MLLSQSSQRMLEATLILIDSYTPLFYLIDDFKKFSGVVDLDQWSKSGAMVICRVHFCRA